MISVASSADPHIRKLLQRHPKVRAVESGPAPGVEFYQEDWRREVRIGDTGVELYGLVELMDNNPLVCADVISVPSPATTLALIAMGPVAWAGLLAETPTMVSNEPVNEPEMSCFLQTVGWPFGAVVHYEPVDLDGVLASTAMMEIRTPEDLHELDDVYEERFGRSFYVSRNEDETWDPSLVRKRPGAVFRLSLSEDRPNSLLTVRVLADSQGKAGAAQVVHAMNVMAGLEESLGISD